MANRYANAGGSEESRKLFNAADEAPSDLLAEAEALEALGRDYVAEAEAMAKSRERKS